jgi:hypothetical protein
VTWERACSRIGVGTTSCVRCSESMDAGKKCFKCESKRWTYSGLIFHDLRRTAARNLRCAGISETVIMKIGGWRTRSVFELYAIVKRNDIADAILKLEQKEKQIQHGHDMVTLPISTPTSGTSNVTDQPCLSASASANQAGAGRGSRPPKVPADFETSRRQIEPVENATVDGKERRLSN